MSQLSYRTLWEEIRSQKHSFWRSNLYGILTTLLLLPIPLLIPLLIDEILLHHPGQLTAFFSERVGISSPAGIIVAVTVTVLLLRISAFLTSAYRTRHAVKISGRVGYALRHRILRRMERLALSEYEKFHTGGIVGRTIQDVEVLGNFVTQLVTRALSAVMMLLGVSFVLLWIDWRLALLVFLFNPFFLVFARLLGRKTGKYLRKRNEAYQSYQELLSEVLDLFVQVRASNQERRYFYLIRQRAKAIEKSSLEYGYRATLAQSASSLLTSISVDLFRAFGIAAVCYSDLSIGMMIAFLFYLSTLIQPSNQILSLLIAYRSSRPALERINALLSLPLEPLYPQKLDPFAGKHTVSVTVDSLHFAYPEGPEVLHGISLHAKAGEKVALVGPSGSGKSTVAQLLVGFYPLRKGRILYGDAPLEEIGLERIRAHVALMLQDSLFFNDTIRINITLGREISEHKIYEALAMAQLESFVRGLERGLDTLIGRNGIRLSGGQKQRLAIARLILSDPDVIIFDEATSALDGETEAQLYRSLAPFLAEKTVLIIAHRETTIRQADRIYLMEKGSIVDEGTYHRLLDTGKLQRNFDAE